MHVASLALAIAFTAASPDDSALVDSLLRSGALTPADTAQAIAPTELPSVWSNQTPAPLEDARRAFVFLREILGWMLRTQTAGEYASDRLVKVYPSARAMPLSLRSGTFDLSPTRKTVYVLFYGNEGNLPVIRARFEDSTNLVTYSYATDTASVYGLSVGFK